MDLVEYLLLSSIMLLKLWSEPFYQQMGMTFHLYQLKWSSYKFDLILNPDKIDQMLVFRLYYHYKCNKHLQYCLWWRKEFLWDSELRLKDSFSCTWIPTMLSMELTKIKEEWLSSMMVLHHRKSSRIFLYLLLRLPRSANLMLHFLFR